VEVDGLWRSDDDGATWIRASEGLSSQDVHGIAIVPATNGRPRTVLATTNNDLNESTDDGRTWRMRNVGSQFPWSYCRGIAARADAPQVLFLGNGDGPPGTIGALWRSLDAGATWQRCELPGVPNSTIWSFAVHAADAAVICAYSVSGEVYLSRDGGDHWKKLAREFGEIRAFAWAPTSGEA
jgi:photosystem II stability/assembly factor-like uncharacterized protein